MKTNAELEKFNEDVVKFQSKVKIAYRPQSDSTGRNEIGMMRVSNWREPINTEVDVSPADAINTSGVGLNKSNNSIVSPSKTGSAQTKEQLLQQQKEELQRQ
jgi:hypothetical protein